MKRRVDRFGDGEAFGIKYGPLEALVKILEWLKPSPRTGWVVMLTTAAMLLMTRIPGVADIVNNSVIGKEKALLLLAFFGSSSLMVTYGVEYGLKRTSERKRKRKLIARLSDLTVHEKKALQNYLQDENRAYTFGREGGAADVLVRDGVLHLSSRTPEPMYGQILVDLYFIEEDAWKHLHKHPELIELTPNSRVAD